MTDQNDDSKQSFREFWDAVLRGEKPAQSRAYDYIQRAVGNLARNRPDISADSLAATVARTLMRRVEDDPDSVEASDFDHFRNLARQFGLNKLRNAARKRDRYSKHVGSVPVTTDDQGNDVPFDPADWRQKTAPEQVILKEWSESFIEAVEELAEPDRTIMRTALEVAFRHADNADDGEDAASEPRAAGRLGLSDRSAAAEAANDAAANEAVDAASVSDAKSAKRITYRRVPFVREVHQALAELGMQFTESALRMRIRRVGQSISRPLERE